MYLYLVIIKSKLYNIILCRAVYLKLKRFVATFKSTFKTIPTFPTASLLTKTTFLMLYMMVSFSASS